MFSSHSGAHHIEDASTPMEEDCPPLLQHKMLEWEWFTCTDNFFGKKNEKLEKMLVSDNHQIKLYKSDENSLFCDWLKFLN